ncbi:hypothetical protein Hamer_G019945, partial [Homarus americanus]
MRLLTALLLTTTLLVVVVVVDGGWLEAFAGRTAVHSYSTCTTCSSPCWGCCPTATLSWAPIRSVKYSLH